MASDKERFIDAALRRDTEEACRLIRASGLNPTVLNIEEMPALHYCCDNNLLDVVKVCYEELGEAFDAERKDRNGDTLLHCACDNKGTLELVRFLVETAGANVETRNRRTRCSPLHRAAMRADQSVIRYLVDQAWADVDARDMYGGCALLNAIRYQDDDCIIYLARQARVESSALRWGWKYARSRACKQALVENFGKRELKLSSVYVSNYPLHTVLQTPLPVQEWHRELIEQSSTDDAAVLDLNGQLPLHVALGSMAVTSFVGSMLMELEPRCAGVRDLVTGFYPFEAAALRTVRPYDDDDEFCDLGLVYKLFRTNPGHFLATRRVGSDHGEWRNRRVRQKTNITRSNTNRPVLPNK